MDEECKIIYFYKNGHPCEPKSITKTRCKLMEVIKRHPEEGYYTYEGKKLYTFDGEELFAFRPAVLPLHTGYVLVDEKDKFKNEDYETAFLEMLKEMKRFKVLCEEVEECPQEDVQEVEELTTCYAAPSIADYTQVLESEIPDTEYSTETVSEVSLCQPCASPCIPCVEKIEAPCAKNTKCQPCLISDPSQSSCIPCTENKHVQYSPMETSVESCIPCREPCQRSYASCPLKSSVDLCESSCIPCVEKEPCAPCPCDIPTPKSRCPPDSLIAMRGSCGYSKQSCSSTKQSCPFAKPSCPQPKPSCPNNQSCPMPNKSCQLPNKSCPLPNQSCPYAKKSMAESQFTKASMRSAPYSQKSILSKNTAMSDQNSRVSYLINTSNYSQNASTAIYPEMTSHNDYDSRLMSPSETSFATETECSCVDEIDDSEGATTDQECGCNRIEMKIRTNIISSRQIFKADAKSEKMSCGKEKECVNLYFFENGVACNPKKVTKKRGELEGLVTKVDTGFTYSGKMLYSLKGELLCKFDPMELPCDSGYVLIGCGEKYKCADYETAFKKAKEPPCPAAKPTCPPAAPACPQPSCQ